MRSQLMALTLVTMVTACGGTGSVNLGPATAANVSVQGSDLPKGFALCKASEDIQTLLNQLKTDKSPAYDKDSSLWAATMKAGAASGELVFFAQSSADCPTRGTSFSAQLSKRSGFNLVVQFKDEASATDAFSSGSVMGLSAADFENSMSDCGCPVGQGAETGLTTTSVVASGSADSGDWYVAIWANKAFYVTLFASNVDAKAMGTIATTVNRRIH
jgi:hypothetical protein